MTQASLSNTQPASHAVGLDPTLVAAAVETACARIAPAWPLDRLIAVNPYWGYVDQPIEDAAARLTALSGTRLTMPRAWFQARLADGTFAVRHIALALAQLDAPMSVEAVMELLARPLADAPRYPTLVDVVDAHRDLTHAMSYSEFVTRQLTQACAAYVDEAQSTWSRPRDGGFYPAFRELLAHDASPRLLMGQRSISGASLALPSGPGELIAYALATLGVTPAEHEDYLSALLLSMLGWASAFAFSRWDARLYGRDDDDIVHLLAARLTWEVLLASEVASPESLRFWKQVRGAWHARADEKPTDTRVDWVLQRALEIAYQEGLALKLQKPAAAAPSEPPRAQLAFCIDVRSEVMRRHLEEGRPHIKTLGFAGFFGLPAAYKPLQGPARTQLPGLLAPSLRIEDRGEARDRAVAAAAREAHRTGLAKGLARNPLAMFSWVETLGLGAAVSLARDTLALGHGGSDPLRHHPNQHGLVPTLVGPEGETLTATRRASVAAGILRGMSLTANFARVVALFGHGATSDNNPQAAGLQCGACGGQSGEVNARALALLLNDPEVRAALVEEGIVIPDHTHFVGGLHDTTTDTLSLFDLDRWPATHADDLATLRAELLAASSGARAERAPRLALGGTPDRELARRLDKRSRDWSETRPEWGLARNAAFIAAPRERTRGLDLEGRAFLHEYEVTQDAEFKVLEQIMCAPMVVGHFINMQYNASTVDNLRYGSGNKVLHNVVGGSVGLFEGAGGDLRFGLALQSLHDGQDWVHMPQRLSVYLEAPPEAIDAVIAKHDLVRNIVDNEWLFLFAIEPGGGGVSQRAAGGWQRSQYE